MYAVMYNYHGDWIHTDNVDSIPPLVVNMTIDILDEHYNIARIIYQPVQKRFKVFLERL